jgi:hypothetical protein
MIEANQRPAIDCAGGQVSKQAATVSWWWPGAVGGGAAAPPDYDASGGGGGSLVCASKSGPVVSVANLTCLHYSNRSNVINVIISSGPCYCCRRCCRTSWLAGPFRRKCCRCQCASIQWLWCHIYSVRCAAAVAGHFMTILMILVVAAAAVVWLGKQPQRGKQQHNNKAARLTSEGRQMFFSSTQFSVAGLNCGNSDGGPARSGSGSAGRQR